MAQTIDFLPASYHQNRQRRQKTIWRRGVLAVFLTMIVLGTVRQRQTQLALQATRDRLQQRANRMFAELGSREVLQERIRHLEAEANLAAHLQVRTPSTRLLATVTNALPRFVTLTEIRSNFERLATESNKRTETNSARNGEDDSSDRLPEEFDLQRLQKQRRRFALFVELNGIAPDDVAISRYLAALENSATFDQAQLLYTDQHVYRGQPMRSFGIRLRTRKVVDQPAENGKRKPELSSRGAELSGRA